MIFDFLRSNIAEELFAQQICKNMFAERSRLCNRIPTFFSQSKIRFGRNNQSEQNLDLTHSNFTNIFIVLVLLSLTQYNHIFGVIWELLPYSSSTMSLSTGLGL